jgi:hypothetical protein
VSPAGQKRKLLVFGIADPYKVMGFEKEFGEGIGLGKCSGYAEGLQVHMFDCIAI